MNLFGITGRRFPIRGTLLLLFDYQASLRIR